MEPQGKVMFITIMDNAIDLPCGNIQLGHESSKSAKSLGKDERPLNFYVFRDYNNISSEEIQRKLRQ